MQDDYGSIWTYRLKWAYLLLVVTALMSPGVLRDVHLVQRVSASGPTAMSSRWNGTG